MNLNKGKVIAILILFIIIAQACLPILGNISVAAKVEITDGWDVSTNDNGSVIAKLDETGTLIISGAGSMKNWDFNTETYAPWYEERSNITKIIIEDGITTIGKSAFVGCSKLTDIVISEGVMSIGSYAFMDCSSLTSIEIPEGVTSLGDGAFSGCTSLKNVVLPKGLSKIGSLTFNNCSSLETLKIPAGVKEIGYLAFQQCEALTDVIIPSETINIHNQAFVQCNLINIICKSNTTAETYAREMNIKYITDDEHPQIEFLAEEGNEELSINVQVRDNIIGLDESSLKYTWSTKKANVQIDEITTKFNSGDTIKNENLTGEYYLWVVAADLLGNYIIQNTTACNFDNTLPTVTVNQSWINPLEITITAADLGSGTKDINDYSYYVSTNDTALIEGQWRDYVSGTPIIVENGRTEDYYLFVKTISDKAGNVSNANGTMVTIEDEIYHRFGPYTREREEVLFSSNGNDKWESKVFVQVSGLGDNLYKNYKYAWIEEGETLNIGDSGAELKCVEFDTNEVANNTGTEDGKYYLVIVEKFTNQIIAKSNVFNFTTDIVAPTLEVKYSTTDKTKENVIVNIIASEEIQEIEGWKLSEDRLQLTKEYTQNTEESILIKDLVGNETEQKIQIVNIDKVGPVAKVEYSATEITNQNVMVTINSDKELQEVEGWTLSEDKKHLTKEYEQNTKETVILEDLMGNKTEQSINVSNIDKVPTNVEVKYSSLEKTNESSKVTIVAEEEIQPIDGWELSEDRKQLIKNYVENIEETVIIKDLAGNETQQVITITNVDKTSAVVNVNYSTTEITSQNVIVTITSNEELQGIEGWELSEDKLQLTKEYSRNTKEEGEKVLVKDLAGNETEQIITIRNIDKIAPAIKIIYSSLRPTDQNVAVIILGNEQMQPVEGWALSEDKLQLTKIYEENLEEVVVLKDIFGNEREQLINISNIDKIPTVIDLAYSTTESTNANVIVTITSNKELQNLEGWKLSEDKMQLTKEYSVNTEEKIIVKDIIGHEMEQEIKISNIDKDGPSIKLVYSIEKTRNPKATVIIISDEPVQPIEGWELSEDNRQLIKIYKETQEEKITLKDLIGNEIQETIEVVCEKAEIIKGDVNGDGRIDLTDMTMVNEARLGKLELAEDEAIAADITEDGRVDFKDMMKINKIRLDKDVQ